LLALAGCGHAEEQPLPLQTGCIGEKLKLDASGKVTAGSKERVLASILSGSNVRVGIHFLAGDLNSKEMTTWFEPIATTVVGGDAYIESPHFFWAASNFSTTADIPGRKLTAFRVSTSGKFQRYQQTEPGPLDDLIPQKPEIVSSTWCVIQA
jgi:hypothetical protein